MKRLLVCAFVVTMLPGCPTFLANRPTASTEPEGMTVVAFRAQKPSEPTTITADCRLSDAYVGAWRNTSKTHYAVMVRHDADAVYGYAPMDSQVGRETFELLRDGKDHRLKITLQFVDPKGQPVTDREAAECVITAVATAR